jgi:hypothetical protein
MIDRDKNGELYEGDNIVQDLLNRMARAHKRGTGLHISADELHALSVTMIGQWWSQDDPRATKEA